MSTSQFSVNAAGNPEAVIADTVCDSIEIGEDPSVAGWPTVDYLVYKRTVPGQDVATITPRQKVAGTTYTFRKPKPLCYLPGEVVGWVATTTGSSTFFKDEQLSP